MNKRFTSRSAALAFKVCPYKRYLTYHYNQTGLVPQGEALSLLVGTCIHRGLQHLLEHCRLEHSSGNFEEKCINEAVDFAIDLWRTTLSNNPLGGLHGEEVNNLTFVIAEHETIIEALIRSFAIQRLPSLLEEYEVLEVEHEEVFEDFTPPQVCDLCIGTTLINKEQAEKWFEELFENLKTIGFTKQNDLFACPKCDGTGKIHPVVFLGKADGLFRRKIDNKLIVLSIKTASEYADVTLRNILHDMQNSSEWYIIQDRISKAWIKYKELSSNIDPENTGTFSPNELKFLNNYHWMKDYQEEPKIFAVQYEHLITGLYRDFTKTGIRSRQSFLIHPLKLEVMGGYNIFSKQTHFNPDEYIWKTGKGPNKKGWNKINIWEDIGIKLWIDLLAKGEIQPEEGNALENVIRTSELVLISPEVLEEWLISTSYQEEKIAEYLNVLDILEKRRQTSLKTLLVNDNYLAEIQRRTYQFFPKNTMQCHNYYGHDCEFVLLCHFGVPLEETQHLYQIRKAHHELEANQFKKDK